MIGKLKEVGNKVLGKFGMSLDNFKMVQDPATGGYSIKYEKWAVCHKHDTRRIHSLGGMGIAGTSSDSSRMILLPLRMFVVRITVS